MSKFSSTLQLTDFDDFITPSQECVKPVTLKNQKQLSVGIKGKTLKKVEITLNDCLACSGCITSAETLLVTSQSHQEFLRVINEIKESNEDEKKLIIVSISPQARVSLAVEEDMTDHQVCLSLSNFFLHFGVNHVLDTSFAQDLALIESHKEFIQRYQQTKAEKTEKDLPIMTSSCPGWICYAEKTHGKLIIPHLSKIKSAQQITGTIVKQVLSSHYDITPSRVYHVTVMPCYDKKLEASREDFYNDLYSTRDVDLVLTSGEILTMLKELNKSLKDFMNTDETVKTLFKKKSNGSENGKNLLQTSMLINKEKYFHQGGGSGGYLEYIFKSAAKELFNIDVNEIEYKTVRNNKDFQEVKLKNECGDVLLSMAVANGFRSIQNLVQKLKRKKCGYDYIEVMACPSGCLNGGGQIKSQSGNKEDQKKRLEKVEDFYKHLSTQPCPTPSNEAIVNNDDVKKAIYFTEFHEIEKNEDLNISVKW